MHFSFIFIFKLFTHFYKFVKTSMAKKTMIQKENRKRALVNKYSQERQKLKNLMKKTSNITEKINLQHQLQELPKNSSTCRLRNRCWLTGRSRGYYRHFGLSRHVLREMAREGLLPGVIKSSW